MNGVKNIVATGEIAHDKYAIMLSKVVSCRYATKRLYVGMSWLTYISVFNLNSTGDFYTGLRLIVCADYDQYMIQWGCLKFSQEKPNICSDTTTAILTRKRNPSKKTREAIDNFLTKKFSMVVADLDQMKHDKRKYHLHIPFPDTSGSSVADDIL